MARPGFGTDGLRGVANVDLTPELVTALGRAAARVLAAPGFLTGRDTRRSGPMLQAALAAGMAAEGADVVDLGVLPTAGVAFCAGRRNLPAAMVSASHNPFQDNGIKLFDAAGVKLAPEVEAAVESELDRLFGAARNDGPGWSAAAAACTPGAPGAPGPLVLGRMVGRLASDASAGADYRRHLARCLDGRRLDGLHVVVDCANGAAVGVAPDVLGELGATVEAISCDPDGTNINSGCGSTQPAPLAEAVVAADADLGLAFDGDADRVVAVDRRGRVLDGDELLALFAIDLRARGELAGMAVVVTVMTNLGFRRAMAARGIAVVETPVGDRQVLAALDERGLALGGEQSGHLVFRRLATTGDGVLTGILLADMVARSGRPLAELADGLVERVPQVLVNVPVAQPGRLGEAPDVWRVVDEVRAELGDAGRVLLRPSGTEPVVRVMVEAPTPTVASEAAARLRAAVEGSLGVAAQ